MPYNIQAEEDFVDTEAAEIACPQCDSEDICEIEADEFDCCNCGCSWRYVAVCCSAM